MSELRTKSTIDPEKEREIAIIFCEIIVDLGIISLLILAKNYEREALEANVEWIRAVASAITILGCVGLVFYTTEDEISS
jgi:hypothetical protein